MGELLKLFLWLLDPLLNERGTAGEDDDDGTGESGDEDDGQGEGADDSETELDTDLDDEDEGDESERETDNLVPQERFNKVYAAQKEAERKLNEFQRLGPEAYYKLYPDEAPESLDDDEDEVEHLTDAGAMVVKGGKYDGMTLKEVYATDPAEAAMLHNKYMFDERDAATKTESEEARLREESDREIVDFKSDMAKAGLKKELSECNKEEVGQLDALVNEITLFMEKTGRGGGILADAYFLMNKDDILSDVKNSAAKQLIAQLSDSTATQSISSIKTSKTTPGYGEYINMTRDQLAEVTYNMTEEEEAEFYKKAPPEFRKKHPDLFTD
jgi:hypothetical protein